MFGAVSVAPIAIHEMDPAGVKLFIALLMTGLFVVPCALGTAFATRAVYARLRGRPRPLFPFTSADARGAVVVELSTLVFCSLGLVYGLVMALGILLVDLSGLARP
ncbi:MAG: hypothetical protein C0481_15610 [Phenylobacterium sp.]|uniref:hypothetical protein n=1 Tax=Phenylobacterium sp. TaxID=1871053 RepID=UPI0025FEAD14|nr:hypothetical protein [Phenylobacterium sp.]MBA4013291.1 hypothetical protein [Phenylobacterium sp.]